MGDSRSWKLWRPRRSIEYRWSRVHFPRSNLSTSEISHSHRTESTSATFTEYHQTRARSLCTPTSGVLNNKFVTCGFIEETYVCCVCVVHFKSFSPRIGWTGPTATPEKLLPRYQAKAPGTNTPKLQSQYN